MTDNNDNLEYLQAVCDACLEVSDRLDLTAHELIIAVAANLGRFVAVASEENEDVSQEELKALALNVFEAGVNVQPILYPAVEESAARLRFFINCTHTEQQILHAVNTAAEALREIHPRYFETPKSA